MEHYLLGKEVAAWLVALEDLRSACPSWAYFQHFSQLQLFTVLVTNQSAVAWLGTDGTISAERALFLQWVTE